MNWIDVYIDTPKESKDYLCWTIYPGGGGSAIENYQVIKWDVSNNKWDCKGVIVAYWSELPPPPKYQISPLTKNN